jgi:hypothetical protein
VTGLSPIPVSEAQAERAVCDLFELYGWDNVKLREDITRGTPGLPDRLFTSPHGLQLWVEMKRPATKRNPKGHVRKAQKERLIEWRKRGVPCCVADGVSYTLRWIASPSLDGGRDTLAGCDSLMAEYDWWPA